MISTTMSEVSNNRQPAANDDDILQVVSLSSTRQRVEEIIYANGSQHFNALIDDIYNAKNSIDLETFIFDKDHLGDRIVNALEQAAQRGVHVRILVDGAGSPLWTTNYAKRLEDAGAKTRVFHPFPWQMWNWSRSVVKLPWMLKMIY